MVGQGHWVFWYPTLTSIANFSIAILNCSRTKILIPTVLSYSQFSCPIFLLLRYLSLLTLIYHAHFAIVCIEYPAPVIIITVERIEIVHL